jgi:AcrR family transcriptional regulator
MDQEKEVIQIRDVTQDEILLSALRLFTTKGYFSTSLVDVAQLLEMENTSVIYQHFKDKKMMASQLYVNIFDSLDISVDDISRKNEKASEQLKGLTDLLFKLTDEAPDVMRFLLVLKLDEFLPDEKQIHETLPFLKVVKII